MFTNVVPNFGKGRILKKEMLENLRDFPRDFFDIYHKDYSNGIISGADALVGENNITIAKGILKHNGRIYLLSRDYSIPYYPTNKYVLIKVKFQDKVVDGDFDIYSTCVFLDENTEVGQDELELGRFKLREGAVLRSDYTDFYDFITEFNTINVINVEYAGWKNSTLNPLVLRYFSEIILKSGTDNVNDLGFAMQCINSGLVDRRLILYYVTKRLGMEFKDYSNMQIYKYLTFIVKEVESGIKRKVETKPSGPSRIIVD
jgi:hypothetical protein